MYISPNSDIFFYKNAPFSPDCQHTVLFLSATSQRTYFSNYVNKEMFGNQSYQRVNKNKIRIQSSVDHLRDYNYVAFRNTNYSNKWFYAFVTNYEYINNAVTEVEYKIDVIQTYFFDVTFKECLVEREHSSTDVAGDNIVDENIPCNEYVFNSYYQMFQSTQLCTIAGVTEQEGEYVSGNIYDGVYHGDEMEAFLTSTADGVSALNSFLSTHMATPGNVTQLYTAPLEFISFTPGSYQKHMVSGYEAVFRDYSMGNNGTILQPEPELGTENGLDGYIPKNNKLYTYPYNFLHIDNGNGSELNLRYEFFANPLSVAGRVACTLTQPVTARFIPLNYKNTLRDLTNQLKLDGYPLCSWASDTYAAWVAQNTGIEELNIKEIGIKGALSTLSGMAVTGFSPISAMPLITGVVRTGANLIGAAHDMAVNRERASFATDVCRGSANSNITCATHSQSFFYGRCSIHAQQARIIDDYFTRFGYAVKRIKQPNFSARPHWNYIKTSGCELNGSIPADAYREFCDIFDSGITFWKSAFEVGNYQLDNRLV